MPPAFTRDGLGRSPPTGFKRPPGENSKMANNPGQIEQDTNAIVKAWGKFAPAATFGGMTLEQYTNKVQPSLDARGQISTRETEIKSWTDKRDDADVVTDQTNGLVIKGIVGDVNYGDNSDLYEACGYIRKSEKKSGLTRKDQKAAAAAKAKKTPPAS
jgi:hypothetical protein